MNDVKRIVLTGGPCGGKTTALARITERLQSFGYHVLVVPETATMLISGARLNVQAMSELQAFQFETELVDLQFLIEKAFERLASLNKPAVIIQDRGLMDAAAFVSEELWQAILDQNRFTTVFLRDHYNAVIHITTAADGAEEFYTLDNNPARTETPEQARKIDARIKEVWMGCPYLRVIDNSTDFEGKLKRIVGAICGVVGIPEPLEIERKYLIEGYPPELPVSHVNVSIDQTYLAGDDKTEGRVRRRGQQGSYVYTHCIKIPTNDPAVRVEKERQISAREYMEMLQHADPERSPVHKTRSCFLYDGQYFELDVFHGKLQGLVLLEVELDSVYQEINLPPFLYLKKEVTNDAAYNNYELAGRPDWAAPFG